MVKVIPICPEHQEELRQEYLIDDENYGYISGFCAKCAKHYRLCGFTHYTDCCIKKDKHEGDHLSERNISW
jgi:hypothetical protein